MTLCLAYSVFPTTLWSLIGATVAAPIVFRILVAAKSRQTVSQHLPEHAAKQGTPTMGGFIILIGLAVAMAAMWKPEFVIPAVIAGTFALVGFIDDFVVPRWMPGKRGLGWTQKLAMQIAGSTLPIYLWQSTDPLTIAVTAFLILFFSNAFNFADGLDSLAAGIGFTWCVGALVLGSMMFPPDSKFQIASDVTLAALAGGFLPFLLLNAPPAKVFMGDVGALPIGALMGWAVSLIFVGVIPLPELGWQSQTALFIFAFGLMLLELVPVPLQILSVKLRKKRLFSFKTPIHHGLQDAGWPETRIAATFIIVQIMLGIIASGIIWLDPRGFK